MKLFKQKNPKVSYAKIDFDRLILKKNEIEILFADERWKKIFGVYEKTDEVTKKEKNLQDLLDEEVRITDERSRLITRKTQITQEMIKAAGENYGKKASHQKKEMKAYQKELEQTNRRIEEIGKRLEIMPDLHKEANIELLEITTGLVYSMIKNNSKRIKALDGDIERYQAELREMQLEKVRLANNNSEIYTLIHNLLGYEQVDKLDKKFLN